jgi:hypothetical protein
MSENKQVAFRRIHGRIVPIKVKSSDDKRRRNFGIGAVGVGAAVSAAGGYAETLIKREAGRAESLFKKSPFSANRIKTRNFIFKAGDPDLIHFARREAGSAKVLGIGKKAGRKAAALRRIAPHIKTAGIWAGASLIGSGLARIFESKNEDNLTGTFKELGFTAATAAALYGAGDKELVVRTGRALAKILSKGKIK